MNRKQLYFIIPTAILFSPIIIVIGGLALFALAIPTTCGWIYLNIINQKYVSWLKIFKDEDYY